MPLKRKTYKKKAYRRKRYVKKGYKRKNTSISSVKIKQPGVIAADRYFVKLRYVDTTSSKIGVNGNNFGYFRYIGNSVFDPNPLLLSTNVPGFKELSLMYFQYRVSGAKLQVTCANMENFPVIVLIWPTTVDQAGVVSNVYLQGMIGNPYVRFKILSAKGGMDKCILKSYISWKKLLGQKTISTDQDYGANVTGNPLNLMWWNFGAYTLDAGNFTTAAVQFEARVQFYTQFYNRVQLQT